MSMTGKSQGKQFQDFAMSPVYRRLFSHVLNTWPAFLVPLTILTLFKGWCWQIFKTKIVALGPSFIEFINL